MATAKRSKPTPEGGIKSLDDARVALADLAAAKRELDFIQATLNESIDLAKAEAARAAAPHRETISRLESELAVFATLNKAELFKDRKSQELEHGSFGFRLSSKVATLAKITWEQVLGKLREMKMTEAIRVKEEPDKEVLRTWPPERLALVGCRLTESDTFWVETKEEELNKDAA